MSGAVLVAALVAALAPASTQSELEQGVSLYWSGQYRGTIAALSETCGRNLRRDETVECLKYLGFSHVAVGDSESARHAFRNLLQADRGYQLESASVSPKILDQFGQAKSELTSELFTRGKSSYSSGSLDEAVESFEAVLALDGGHALAQEYLELLSERRELIRTERELAAAKQAAPEPAPTPQTQAPPEPDDRVYHVTSDIDPPELVHRVDPRYPLVDRRAGREGTVVITVVVDGNGDVAEAKIIRGVSEAIDRAAVEAVMQWTYRPAFMDGRTVSVYSVIRLAFSLR